jgi:ABC-2 type transport system permease protein
MRWLLLKDLQILRRSPLLVALLVIYPVVLAVLIGLALSAGPEKPKVAFVNLVPPEKNEFSIGGQKLDASKYADQLFKSIDPIRVKTRAEAVAKVRSGEALGALILPPDATDRLQDTLNLSGAEPPEVEVLYNAEDPVKRRYVESTVESRLADANGALSKNLTTLAAKYIGIVTSGGDFTLLGQDVSVLGLKRSAAILDGVIASLPAASGQRAALEPVARFARLAADNLDVSKPILRSIATPVQVKQTIVKGKRTPLDTFAVAVAVTISLMFVTLLLAAGMLALEREEHVFGRLVRGLVTRTGLLVEKVGLAALCSTVVTALMLIGLALFVDLDWARAALWLPALVFGAAAFAALGVAIGALAREVRAASLLALMLSLPIAFLALVPSGSVSAGLFDVVNAISALFPFKPALRALDAALNDAEPGMPGPLLHLALLTVGFTAVARVAIRRFS